VRVQGHERLLRVQVVHLGSAVLDEVRDELADDGLCAQGTHKRNVSGLLGMCVCVCVCVCVRARCVCLCACTAVRRRAARRGAARRGQEGGGHGGRARKG
jgi:hypothetical protein